MNIWNLWLVSVVIIFHPPRFKPFWQGFPYYTCFLNGWGHAMSPACHSCPAGYWGPWCPDGKPQIFWSSQEVKSGLCHPVFQGIFWWPKNQGEKVDVNRCPEPDDWGFLNFENFIAVWGSYSQHTPGNKINIYIYIIVYLYIQVFLLKNA